MLIEYCRTSFDEEGSAPYWVKEKAPKEAAIASFPSRESAMTEIFSNEYSIYHSRRVPLDAEICAQYPYILAVHQDRPDGRPELVKVLAYADKKEATETADTIADMGKESGVAVRSIGCVLDTDSAQPKEPYGDFSEWIVRCGWLEEHLEGGGIEEAFSIFIGDALEMDADEGEACQLYGVDSATGESVLVDTFLWGEDGCCLLIGGCL